MHPRFNRSLKFGQIGEGYIAQWLIQARGFHILPVYEKELETGKGPTLFTCGGTLIAPDLFAYKRIDPYRGWKHERVLWIEAKTKSAFSWHRTTRRWTTGIDQRHYQNYLQINSQSLWPVWLLFLHLDGRAKDTPPGLVSPQGLFGETLSYLSRHINHTSPNWGSSGMVYWAHEELLHIATLEEVLNIGKIAMIA